MKRYIDKIIDNSKKIPGSNQYSNTQHRKEFFDKNKKSRIFTSDRKSAISILAEEKKYIPGIGKYDSVAFDEKRCKPPKGTYTQKEGRVS
jgi:hypothetical protein